MHSNAVQIKKRHPTVEQLRDASLAWVLEIEGEVDEKVGDVGSFICCLVVVWWRTKVPRSPISGVYAAKVCSEEGRRVHLTASLFFAVAVLCVRLHVLCSIRTYGVPVTLLYVDHLRFPNALVLNMIVVRRHQSPCSPESRRL